MSRNAVTGPLRPAHVECPERFECDVVFDQAGRGLAHEDRARGGALLQARRQMRAVADGGVVHSQVVADGADHDEPGVEPHAHADRDPGAGVEHQRALDRPGDAERGQGGAARVILVRQRGAEERHEAIAEELVDGALVAVDLGQRRLEEAVEEVVHGVGPQPFGQRGGPDQVAEEHGDRLALALQCRARGEDALGEVARRVGIGGVRRRHGGPRGLDRAAAGRTEARALRELDAARGTGDRQAGAARDAEARPDGIVVTAATALHACRSGGSDGASRSPE